MDAMFIGLLITGHWTWLESQWEFHKGSFNQRPKGLVGARLATVRVGGQTIPDLGTAWSF